MTWDPLAPDPPPQAVGRGRLDPRRLMPQVSDSDFCCGFRAPVKLGRQHSRSADLALFRAGASSDWHHKRDSSSRDGNRA